MTITFTTSCRFPPILIEKVDRFKKSQRIVDRTQAINHLLRLGLDAYRLLVTEDVGYITPDEEGIEDSILNTLTPEQRKRLLDKLTSRLGIAEVKRMRDLEKKEEFS